jgi:DNA polymerase (family 10)
MDNDDIAAIFYEVADILDLQGVGFKPQAYRRAARSLESLDEEVAKVAERGELKDIPGVGEAIAEKIEEVLRTGRLAYLEKLRAEVPAGLLDILRIPDMGPKRAMMLHDELGVSTIEELKSAALEHKLRSLKGFGEKSEEKILQGIATLEGTARRTLLGDAYPIAQAYVDHLRSKLDIRLVSPAGSLRRGKETVGDIDILAGSSEPAAVMSAFLSYPRVSEVLVKGPTKSSVRLKRGMQVDLRVVEPGSYGAALQYFTGSKEHNVALRGIGVKAGLKLNEYGVFDRDSGDMIAGADEEEVYRALGLRWMPPEIRENAGEIEASAEDSVPELVERERVLGDFHVHTSWSDGANSVEEMVKAALANGHSFVAVTDHSQSLKITHGLTPERLEEQVREIDRLKEKYKGRITILAGSEVDIKADGSLDFDEAVLRQLDIVMGSVHSRFKMERSEMTRRVVAAIESGWVDILGHPTGRLIGEREPYEVDLEKVFEAAKRLDMCMEINSYPNRLDLRDVNARLAKERGVRVALGTDAHRTDELGYLGLGVVTARRGWLTDDDVANTMSPDGIAEWLRGRRR